MRTKLQKHQDMSKFTHIFTAKNDQSRQQPLITLPKIGHQVLVLFCLCRMATVLSNPNRPDQHDASIIP